MHNARLILTSPLLAICALSVFVGSAEEPRIPKHAKKLQAADGVVVYHWTVPIEGKEASRIYAALKVENWPTNSWGAEVLLIPVPDCCGAKSGSASWRKSRPAEIRYLTDVETTNQYRLSFKFK